MSLSNLLAQARPLLAQRFSDAAPSARCILFFSLCDGKERARIYQGAGTGFPQAWKEGVALCQREARRHKLNVRWLRIDWVVDIEATTWAELDARLLLTKRNYFRLGLALDADLRRAFLEQELNANAMLYPGSDKAQAGLNRKNFTVHAQRRFSQTVELDFSPQSMVYIFTHEGLFLAEDPELAALPEGHAPAWLPGPGTTDIRWRDPAALNAGHRRIENLDPDQVGALIDSSANFLARQVKKSGKFIYGHFPCFGREIPTYNSLRHASSVYSMLEAWELTRDDALMAASRRALTYLAGTLIRRYPQENGCTLAYNVDVNDEIKLGANAVSLLAMVKYDELTGDTQYRSLMEELALGIARMQDPDSGGFVHVLNAGDLTVKEAFRIVYYDGEAAFGLMRLYGLTSDPRWLAIVEKAFDHFISADYWKHHDHWLSYCANELTLHKPEEKYFRFGVRNIGGYLDFILKRETTYPTLLELSMAFEAMLRRINENHPEMIHVLDGLDIEKLHRALHYRAHYLLNGFFWPELAMYFAKPSTVVGSFFIRHHTFRVRIDDIEHYLSGYVAYWKMLKRPAKEGGETTGPAAGAGPLPSAAAELPPAPAVSGPVVAWGGDVNLGRRQHYRTAELGEAGVLRIPALKDADLRIVNLECVVATQGEQGVDKGEGGPYYYRARPEMLRVLAAADIDIVTTANNHSGDYGPEALLEQAAWLDAIGIAHTGTGPQRDAAFTPVLRRAGNLNVAVFSIDATQYRFAAGSGTPGSAYLPLNDAAAWKTEMGPRIDAVRKHAHIVLVAVHWGDNLATRPDADKIAVGRSLIDAGADAVLGASAHVLQGIEIYRDRPIIHDAGDLLFDSVRRDMGKSGVFRLELDHNGVKRVVFVPVGIGFGFSEQLAGTAAQAAARDFARDCIAVGSRLTLTQDGCAHIDLTPPSREYANLARAPSTVLDTEALALENQAAYPSASAWEAENVPENARIEPVTLGPLTLVGVRVKPAAAITRRQMLWVESFWRCDAPQREDVRLDIRAVPVRATRMRPWGLSMDHDPCDWMMPTSRWKPGVIYRDYYGLRPPYLKEWENVDLQLTVDLVSTRHASRPTPLPFIIRLAVPGKDQVTTPPITSAPAYRTEFPDSIRSCLPGQTWTADQLETVTGGKWLARPPEGWFVRSLTVNLTSVDPLPAPVMYVAHTHMDRARHEQYSNMDKVRANNWDSHGRLAALQEKLAGAIVGKPEARSSLPDDFPVLHVDDPVRAVIELGIAARQRYRGEVIAVTGTAGKSTTVSMLQSMLGGAQKVLASVGNYNSRVGAPATMANLGTDYDAAVIEIAQSALWMKRGPVSRLVRPTVALITEIGVSQTDARVKSVEDTAKWKSRIFDGLTGTAVAVVGQHLPCFEYVLQQAQRHSKRVVVFGHGDSAEVRIVRIEPDEEGSWVTVALPGRGLRFRVPFPGAGMVNNAVAAASVLHALGRDVEAGVARLLTLQAGEGRLQRQALRTGGGIVQVIDDSFNATTTSMMNALSVFGATTAAPGARKIAVLGRIVHLGDLAQSLHESLARPVLDSGADHIVTHGDEMRFLRAVLPDALLGPHFSDAAALVAYLREILGDGDLMLIKGSRRNSDFGSVARRLAEKSARPLPAHGNGGIPETLDDAETFADYFHGEWLIPPEPGWKPGRMIASLPKAHSGDFIPVVSRKEKSRIGVGIKHIRDQNLPSGLCLITDRRISTENESHPVLKVDSIQDAVEKWIHDHRKKYNGLLFTITGSVGKSTTTLMLSRILKKRGRCLVNIYDNLRSGIYGTACRLGDQDFAVFEVAQGSLPSSSRTLCPDVAILLSVSPAHMERHESLEDLVKCKMQIFEGNSKNGVAVISRDIPHYEIAEEHALAQGRKIITFGQHDCSDFRLVSHDPDRRKFTFKKDGDIFECTQSMPGEHISLNSLAVIAAIHGAGLDWRDFTGDLRQASQPPSGRGNLIRVPAEGGNSTFLDHSYNSNPQSLKAALDMLYQWPAHAGERKIAVLSDMLELGEGSQQYHEEIADSLDPGQLDLVILIGDHMRSIIGRLSHDLRVITLTRISDVFLVLPPLLKQGDIVMLKGSNGTGLRGELKKYLEAIQEDAGLVEHQ
ncbi:CapA family protein [Alcaligenaceae bacterium]|nr:CapA family protein [Alcaligenaceae bacterium]